MPLIDPFETKIDWLAEAEKVAEATGISKDLFREVVRQESKGNPSAQSPKGAIGLSQLMPGTAKYLGVNPNDPYENLQGGAEYLRQMLDKFKDPKVALAAYNAGPGSVEKHKGIPPFKETQQYVKNIMSKLDDQGANSQLIDPFDRDSPQELIDPFDAKPSYKTEPSLLGKIGKTVLDVTGLSGIGKHALDESNKGIESMQRFVDDPTGRTALEGAAGLAQYVFSPITAVSKTYFRDPAEATTRMLGAPEGVTKFVGDTVEAAGTMIPYGGLVKKAITGTNEAVKAAEAAAAIKCGMWGQKPATSVAKAPLQYAEGATPEVIDQTMTAAKTIPERAALAQDTIDAAKTAVSQTWQPSGGKRIGQEIIDYVSQNRDEIPRVLEKYGMTPDELAAEFKAVHTEAGRSLWRLSNLAKQIKKEFSANPELQSFAESLSKDLPEPTYMDRFMGGFKSVENFRRAALTAQTATTFRNIISQSGRFTLGTVDDAFGGAIKGAVSGEPLKETGEQVLKGLGEGLDTITATLHRMTPSGRKAIGDILDTDNALKAKSIMYGSPIQDVTLGNKTTKLLQTLNTTQEYFFRNIAFEAKLEQLLKQSGIKGGIKGIEPNQIPPALLENAANYSLEMTFAALPKSQFGKEWVKTMSNPVFTALANPFPRFMWGNALPFLRDFSPLGFMKALDPKVVAKLASGKPEEFAQAASRATLGTMMLQGAMYLRNSEHAGNEWYEIKVGDKNIDTRAFAPLSTYLFMAEAMSHPDKIKPSDFASAIFSMNRVAGTGLVLTDIIRGKKLDTVNNVINRLAGEYAGSFTTPLRTPKDIYSKMNPNEAIIRDVRENELIGPTMRNIPGISQKLPEAVSPLKPGPMTSETPLLRQTTGMSYKTKNAIQDELEKINFDMGKAFPRTGIPEADRKITSYMQPMVQSVSDRLLNAELYQKMPDPMKRILWESTLGKIRKAAASQLAADDPELMKNVRMKGVGEDIKKIIENGIQPISDANSKED